MKTIDEILEQKYLSANDLRIIIPSLGYLKALEYIKTFISDPKVILN